MTILDLLIILSAVILELYFFQRYFGKSSREAEGETVAYISGVTHNQFKQLVQIQIDYQVGDKWYKKDLAPLSAFRSLMILPSQRRQQAFQEGDLIKIVYPKKEPDQARIKGSEEKLGLSLMISTGLAFFFLLLLVQFLKI